jgi:hypothetical protein
VSDGIGGVTVPAGLKVGVGEAVFGAADDPQPASRSALVKHITAYPRTPAPQVKQWRIADLRTRPGRLQPITDINPYRRPLFTHLA